MQRTRDALASMRARGLKTGHRTVAEQTDLKTLILQMRDEGRSQRQIGEGFPTVRSGREWRQSAVQRICGYERPKRRHTPAALPELPRTR